MMPTYKETYTHYTTPGGNVQVILYRRKAHQKQRERVYYIKQKLSGLTLAAIGIITPILFDGDATISLIALPLGIWLIFTKKVVML